MTEIYEYMTEDGQIIEHLDPWLNMRRQMYDIPLTKDQLDSMLNGLWHNHPLTITDQNNLTATEIKQRMVYYGGLRGL